MRNLTLLALPIFFLSACSPTPELKEIKGYAQGTTYSVKYWYEDIKVDELALKKSIDNELNRIDTVMSNYRDDSMIAAFNQNEVADIPILVDKEILKILKISADVHKKSLGCYDPTVGPLFKIWGFKKDSFNIPTKAEIEEKLKAIGFATKLIRSERTITKKLPQTTIDLSAIGQGYAVAQISKLLLKNGINNFISEIGGEMLVTGKKPNEKLWQVGIERPIPDSKKINEVVTLTGKRATAIMTSGTYRHYFDDNGKRYSHILDPRTGKPVVHNSVAVTVLLADATHADAWSTALLCLGSKEGMAVANQNDIPAIFYDQIDKKQIRMPSNSVSTQEEYWKIK